MSGGSKKVFLTILLCLGARLFAEAWTVEYLDGTLEVNRGGRWIEAAVGDRLDPSEQIRVGRNTIAELASGGAPATLSAPGVYALSDLGQAQAAANGTRSLVGRKIASLLAGRSGGASSGAAVMGVRAGAADTPVTVDWVAEDEQQYKAGRILLQAGRYAEAAPLFLDSALIGIGDERAAAYYYAGYAFAMMDRDAQALKCLAEVPVSERLPYFQELVLLKGRLLASSRSYGPALDVLDAYLRALPQGDGAQEVLLLSALCLQGLKDAPAARARLEKSLAIDPASETGRMAAQILRDLKGN